MPKYFCKSAHKAFLLICWIVKPFNFCDLIFPIMQDSLLLLNYAMKTIAALTLWRIDCAPLRIEHFSVQRICGGVANEQNFFNRFRKFFNSQRSLCGVVLQFPWVHSAFAIKLTETVLRMSCKPTETAVRLWRMHGDCAANHIRYNGNDGADCFVINFILQNNE